MITTLLALLTSVTVIFVTVHARPVPGNQPPLPPPHGRDLQPLQPPVFYPGMRSPPAPSMPNPTPPPRQNLPLLKPQFFFTEARRLLSPKVPSLTPPPDQEPPSLQTPFFYPEMRSPPPLFFFPEPSPQFLPPPFFYPETWSPLPPYLEKGHSPPAGGSTLVPKLITAAVILAAILVLVLALRKCREPGPNLSAIDLSDAVTTRLTA